MCYLLFSDSWYQATLSSGQHELIPTAANINSFVASGWDLSCFKIASDAATAVLQLSTR